MSQLSDPTEPNSAEPSSQPSENSASEGVKRGLPAGMSFDRPAGMAEAPSHLTDDSSTDERVVEVLKTIFDPEIPVNIYELGLIYELDINEAGHAKVVMTLTSPNCPVAESLPAEVEQKVGKVDGVHSVELELTWEPAWSMDSLSEAARLTLGMV